MSSIDTRIVLEVEEVDQGTRLDSYLALSLERASRSAVQRWIQDGLVLVDGEVRKPRFCVQAGQTVVVSPPPPTPTELLPENIPIKIIHEDDELVVVDKPANLVVHPGAGNWTGTLANALAYHFEQISKQGSIRPGIIHRLDKGTSGVMVVAKTDFAHDFLSAQFQRREVEKHYFTLVYGHLSARTGQIDLAIGRDPQSRTRISPRSTRPREARTDYQVLEYLPAFSYVLAKPKTGRTHQIRVHFHHIGHPVVGDTAYTRKDRIQLLSPIQRQRVSELDRLFLHATFLRFTHPKTREVCSFTAPLPDELEQLIRTLGE